MLGARLRLGEGDGIGVRGAGVQRGLWHGAQNGRDEIGGRFDESWGVVKKMEIELNGKKRTLKLFKKREMSATIPTFITMQQELRMR